MTGKIVLYGLGCSDLRAFSQFENTDNFWVLTCKFYVPRCLLGGVLLKSKKKKSICKQTSLSNILVWGKVRKLEAVLKCPEISYQSCGIFQSQECFILEKSFFKTLNHWFITKEHFKSLFQITNFKNIISGFAVDLEKSKTDFNAGPNCEIRRYFNWICCHIAVRFPLAITEIV